MNIICHDRMYEVLRKGQPMWVNACDEELVTLNNPDSLVMRFSKLRCENFPQTKKRPSWCPSSDEPAIFHGMACRNNEDSEIVMDPQFPFGILNVVVH